MTVPATPARIGRYRIVGQLGRGGMGVVYEAVLEGPQGFRKPVALKVLPPATNDTARSALLQEARLGALLAHPNVVGVHALEQIDGVWTVAMELVHGASAHRLLRAGPLPAQAVREIGLQAAAGLAHIHALQVTGRRVGLVHRDIKPSNLLVDRTGLLKIADLGIARLSGAAGIVAGTPGYMPAEQIDGHEDARSDVFALGATLFALVTRRAPFGKKQAALEAVRRSDERLADPAFLAPVDSVLPGLGEVLARCLRADPADRFADAHELHAALLALRGAVAPGRGLSALLFAVRPDLAAEATPSAMVSAAPGSAAQTMVLEPRGNLPARADRFVGRSEILPSLLATLRGEARLVTLLGTGGTGKTRLSLEAARALSRDWPGGAWFCDCAEARSSEGLCAALASTFSETLAPGDPVHGMATVLRGRGAALLVLDNLEQVVGPAADALEVWLGAAPEMRWLATSQVALRVRGEHVISLGPLSVSEAVELFVDRAPRPVAEADLPVVGELVARLDGLPLAVELAAARTRMMAVPAVLARMEDRLRLLSGGGRERPARHRSLLASLEASVELLPGWAAAALAQLSVFVDGWTLEAAEAVLDLPADAAWPLDVLARLMDHSLVRISGDERFGMLHTVQAFAATRLDDSERRRAEVRHGRWYAQLGTSEAVAATVAEEGTERRRRVARERENLVAASQRAVARGDARVASNAAMGAWLVLAATGPVDTALQLLSAAMAMTEADRPLRLQLARGRALHLAGRADDATAVLEATVSAALARGDQTTLSQARGALGQTFVDQGRMEEARACYAQELAAARACGDRKRESDALGDMGGLLRSQGRLEEARTSFEAAIETAAMVGAASDVVLGNLATTYGLLGRVDDAMRAYEKALQGHRRRGDHRNEATSLTNLGAMYADLGDFAESHRFLTASLALTRQVGHRLDEGIALGNLGVVSLCQGDLDAAEACFQAARSICRETRSPVNEAIFLGNLAAVHSRRGDLDAASGALDEAMERMTASNDGRVNGFLEAQRADVYLDQGRVVQADLAIGRAEAWLRRVGDPMELAKALCVRVRERVAVGELGEARAALAEAEALALQVGAGPASELGTLLVQVRAAVRG